MAGALAPCVEIASAPGPLAATLEVRKARPEDTAPARALQRAAFNLDDPGSAPHPGDRDELRVVTQRGRVVSCLTLISAGLCIRGSSVTMGGVRHVATDREEQNQGFASALMRQTLQHLRAEGTAVSVLFPFSFRYYRKFGYELAGNHCHFWCRPNCIPAYQEQEECRAASPTDVAALALLDHDRARARACTLDRGERRWREICGQRDLRVLVHSASPIDGYAVTAEGRDAYGGGVLRVLDLAAATPRAWRGLLGSLAAAPVESVEWYASAEDLASSGLMRSPAPLREGFKPRGIVTVRPMFQLRVVDVSAALRACLAAFPGGAYRLALRVKDELLPENEQPLALEGTAGGARLTVPRGGDAVLELDIRVFSQLYCGYLSPVGAVSQGLARCSSPEALDTAETLFPAGDPFIPELDRF